MGPRKARDEAEKPFWISYADLMTALMVLFLVVMSVALLAVTKTVSERDKKKTRYEQEIEGLMADLQTAVRRYPGMTLDVDRRAIDFGERALFPLRQYALTSQQMRELREFTPEVLAIAESPRGKDLLKRVVVEGFTDETGTYLYNLNLSLQRSQSVLCALFAAPEPGETPFSEHQRQQIVDLFLVGGYSFNSARSTPQGSRRVEFRLELYPFEAARSALASHPLQNVGKCSLP